MARIACMWLAGVSLSLAAEAPAGGLEIAGIFTEHMVLQRKMKVPVWGWAKEGQKVSVEIGGQTKTSVADASGKWRVDLDPMEPGPARTMKVTEGTSSIEIGDILVGEVWLCSGQSNMEWPLSASKDGAKEVAAADLPNIRLFNQAKDGGMTRAAGPADRLVDYDPNWKMPKDHWEVCSPKTVGDRFSAVAYYFGRALQKDLNVPIGLISNPVGGSMIEAWISRKGFESDPSFNAVTQYYDRLAEFAESPEGKKQVADRNAEYDAKQAELKAQGKPLKWPLKYAGAPKKDAASSVWFNTRVNPLIPFAMRGVIWYQGEANGWWAGNDDYPLDYYGLLPLLISDWRKQWGQGEFPFLFVQLPKWGQPQQQPAIGGDWSFVREAQLNALKVPKTGMAVTLDVGDPNDIHPKDKLPVGERLALAARQVAYEQKVVGFGPIYKGMKVEGGSIRVSFDHTGGGLTSSDGGELKQFAIAGADKKFVWAKAVIEKDGVVVSSPEVPAPVAVRYAWEKNPGGSNLTNKEGLLASPFRTDAGTLPSGSVCYKRKLAEPPVFPPAN